MAILTLSSIPIVAAVRDFAGAWPQNIVPRIGIDFTVYNDAAARWLSGQGYFLPHQLAGPYVITHGDVLYPPQALALFVPFVFLPAILWWIIPISLVAWGIWRLKPAMWAWPIMSLALWWPETTYKVVTGNPIMWSVAFVAIGLAPLAAMKLTMLPFAFVGAGTRIWWSSVVVMIGLTIVFIPMLADYAMVLANSENPLGILYNLTEYPIMALPVVAWLARTDGRDLPRS